MRSKTRDWSVLDISVKTYRGIDEISLADDLIIHEDDINEDFRDQPAKYAYWATVEVQAKALVNAQKLEVDTLEDYIRKTLVGELDVEVRATMEMNGEKITESRVTSNIFVHPRYIEETEKLHEAKVQLLKYQEQLGYLTAAKDAMNQRKDMLISLGAQLRQESDNTSLSIKSRQADQIVRKRASREPITFEDEM